MRLESLKHLEDMRQSALLIISFIKDMEFLDFKRNAMMRSAVERQFEIIGEALNRLHQTDPEIAKRISHKRRIIGFRNILIHGYDVVDDHVVWNIVEQYLPLLHQEVMDLLPEDEEVP